MSLDALERIRENANINTQLLATKKITTHWFILKIKERRHGFSQNINKNIQNVLEEYNYSTQSFL